jgi:deazaflavin-dependent oxidoreductase (nitroreductase family)
MVTNPILGRLAPWLPGFGVIYHRGRKSGRVYHNPVNVFRRGDGYVVALTYGSSADWVKNVLAAGQCDLYTRGQCHHLVNPTLYTDTERRGIPAPHRAILTKFNVTEFLALTRSTAARSAPYSDPSLGGQRGPTDRPTK